MENPPYAVNNAGQHLPLSANTTPVTATGINGTLQYNTHNLYGFYEAAATTAALKAITGRRPFALTRFVL